MTLAKLTFSTLLTAVLGTAALAAAERTIGVGDPAPPLKTGKWVQGEAVTSFSKDKVYLVEFWATWCGPCLASIPHVNELYAKFKDKGLVVIGQNVWEQNEAAVERFVRKMGDKMSYRVALDDKTQHKEGAMAETWMKAAGQDGIPAAFLVGKDGKLAWIGHPMSLKEKTVELVLSGQFDLAKAIADAKKEKENEAAVAKLQERFGEAMETKKWDEAETTLKEMAALLPEDDREFAEAMRMPILLGKGDLDGAADLAAKLAEKNKNNAQMLNGLSWGMLTHEGIKGKALDAAYDMALKANTASEGKDPSILDTVARAAFLKGEQAKAIELQEKAVALAEAGMKEQLQAVLDSYKQGKLPAAQ